MKKLKFFVILAPLFIAGGSAFSAEWVKIPNFPADQMIDKSSITRDGDLVTYWMKGAFLGLPGSMVSMHEVNCKKRTMRQIQYSLYQPDGKQYGGESSHQVAAEYLEPGSPPEKILNFVCKRWWEVWK